ncbi:MAG: hypothetical protein GF313_07320 [Caldithrix sp.]|nr:hypothetical protein [Caldithrix sp.]
MLINYLKMAFKNIKHHLGFSVINMVGLGTGLACVILILLWVEDEIGYDRFYEKSDKIGRIIMDLDDMQLPASPGPLAPLMIKEFPEIRNAVRFVWGSGILQYKNKKFEERDLMLVEPAFFEIFSFPFVKGHPGTALDDPGSIVLTESAAKKYFGDENPMGKTMQYFARVDL